jgi:hypothetical protein
MAIILALQIMSQTMLSTDRSTTRLLSQMDLSALDMASIKRDLQRFSTACSRKVSAS